MRECILCRHLAPIATPDRLTATLCATDRLTARLYAKASADLVPHRKERRRGTARICEKNSATCPEKSQNPYYLPIRFKGREQCVMLSQLRLWDGKRLTHKMGQLPDDQFEAVKQALRRLLK